jgi:ribosome-binding factor A
MIAQTAGTVRGRAVSKAAYKRAARVADQIRMEIAEILLRKTKDPRLQAVTVTDVEITDDLRLARVYVTTMQEGEGEAQVMAGLTRASGFIRGELGRRLTLRYNPALEFRKDITGPRGNRILALLEGLHGDVEPVDHHAGESEGSGDES